MTLDCSEAAFLLELGRSQVLELALQGPEGKEYAHHAGDGHTGNLERATALFRHDAGWRLTGKPEQSVMLAGSSRIAPGQELHLLKVPDLSLRLSSRKAAGRSRRA